MGADQPTKAGEREFYVRVPADYDNQKPYRVVYDPRPEGTTPGSCVASDGVPGFRVVVTRLFFENGSKVREEDFKTRYDPENEVRCGTSGPG